MVSALIAAANVNHPGSKAPTDTNRTNALSPNPFRIVRTLMGNASWYGPGFRGHRTASGEVFNPSRSTIASRHLPFGTRVRVTFMRTGRSAEAKVNDRGPFHRSRIIDCSEGLARRIGLHSAGSGRVKVEILKKKQ
jgi:rare lipoprotein A